MIKAKLVHSFCFNDFSDFYVTLFLFCQTAITITACFLRKRLPNWINVMTRKRWKRVMKSEISLHRITCGVNVLSRTQIFCNTYNNNYSSYSSFIFLLFYVKIDRGYIRYNHIYVKKSKIEKAVRDFLQLPYLPCTLRNFTL